MEKRGRIPDVMMKPMLRNRLDEIDNPRFILRQIKVGSDRMGGREDSVKAKNS